MTSDPTELTTILGGASPSLLDGALGGLTGTQLTSVLGALTSGQLTSLLGVADAGELTTLAPTTPAPAPSPARNNRRAIKDRNPFPFIQASGLIFVKRRRASKL